MHEVLKDYPSSISVPILWGDMDAFQHVNNAVYLRWFESSRIKFLEQSGLGEYMKAEKLGPILASIQCHYKQQLRYPDTVQIGSRVGSLGRTSLTINHTVVSAESGQIAAEGHSVIVIFDYHKQRPVRIPDDVRSGFEAQQ